MARVSRHQCTKDGNLQVAAAFSSCFEGGREMAAAIIELGCGRRKHRFLLANQESQQTALACSGGRPMMRPPMVMLLATKQAAEFRRELAGYLSPIQIESTSS